MALVPLASDPNGAGIRRTPGCLAFRLVFDEWHAVFDGAADSVRNQLRESLGVNGIRCLTVPLEELFIELVGGDRP